MRKPYDESLAELSRAVEVVGEPRPVVRVRPRHDDPEFGPSVLRTRCEGARLEDLRLPGLYIARTEFRWTSFSGSDLHLSTCNWNDFLGCDFSRCDLRETDLRGCTFQRCSFADADLSRADLRCSTFEECDFTGAHMEGAVLHGRAEESATLLWLTPEQRAFVLWSDDPGFPEGG